MKPIKLITESDLSLFLKPETVYDVELYLNSIIMMRKTLDDNRNITKKYYIRLYDNKPIDATSFKVSSNAIGLECIKTLSMKHNLYNGGSESDTSQYISFYLGDN